MTDCNGEATKTIKKVFIKKTLHTCEAAGNHAINTFTYTPESTVNQFTYKYETQEILETLLSRNQVSAIGSKYIKIYQSVSCT